MGGSQRDRIFHSGNCEGQWTESGKVPDNEAAETLGISLQAVGSRLDRARRKLRSVMEGSEDHESA
jgi:hypothetical protein